MAPTDRRASETSSETSSEASSGADLVKAEALQDAMGRRPLDLLRLEDLQGQCDLDLPGLETLVRRHRHQDVGAFLERHRLRVWKQALQDAEPGVDGYDLGWESSTQADDAFARQVGMPPRDYAALGEQRSFHMTLPPHFRRDSVLTYLGRDPDSLYEQVQGDIFRFALDSNSALDAAAGPVLVEAHLGNGSVHCRLHGNDHDPDAVYIAHERLRRYLALAIDPASFEARAAQDPLHQRLIGDRLGLSIPQTPTLFDGLIWVIAGQQVSLQVAFTLRRRLGLLCARRAEGDLYAPPTPEAVTDLGLEDLRRIGWSQRKSEYVLDLAHAIVDGDLDLDALVGASAVRLESTLLARRGLGPWSVNYLMMRCFGLADCVPVGDAGLKRGLLHFYGLDKRPSPTKTLELMHPFAPYRSLATFQLWAADATA